MPPPPLRCLAWAPQRHCCRCFPLGHAWPTWPWGAAFRSCISQQIRAYLLFFFSDFNSLLPCGVPGLLLPARLRLPRSQSRAAAAERGREAPALAVRAAFLLVLSPALARRAARLLAPTLPDILNELEFPERDSREQGPARGRLCWRARGARPAGGCVGAVGTAPGEQGVSASCVLAHCCLLGEGRSVGKRSRCLLPSS